MSTQSGWSRKDISIPAAALDYNKHMGGVKLSDTLISENRSLNSFSQHHLDISVANPFLLRKKAQKAADAESIP